MSEIFKKSINSAIFDQHDDVTTVPHSVRISVSLSNQLDELSLTLDRSKSFLITEYIKAGIKETNAMLNEDDSILVPNVKPLSQISDSITSNSYMLNTNYNNDRDAHFSMIKNKEAAAFCKGWKEYIQRLNKGDYVFLYQSGVGIIASGEVDGDLVKSEIYGVKDDKFAKKLKSFQSGFKAISAKEFKCMTEDNVNFRRTMISITKSQSDSLKTEIEKRMKNISVI